MSDIKEIMHHFTRSLIVFSQSTGMQACHDPHRTHSESPKCPQKCSVIEKYFKFPLCSLFLYCPFLQRKKVLIIPKKKYHMVPSEPFEFRGRKSNISLCQLRKKDNPSPPAQNPILFLFNRDIIK